MEFEVDNLEEKKLKLTQKGIYTLTSITPKVFASESSPVDVEDPEVFMQKNGNKVSVTATDNNIVTSIRCAVSPLDPVNFKEEEAFDYTGPVEIDFETEVLVCEAKDDIGNSGFMWSSLE